MVHLFYQTSTSEQVQETLNTFESCKQLDISELESIEHDDVYFVEIDKVEKQILLHIKKLLLDKTDSLIYFFINASLIIFDNSFILNGFWMNPNTPSLRISSAFPFWL